MRRQGIGLTVIIMRLTALVITGLLAFCSFGLAQPQTERGEYIERSLSQSLWEPPFYNGVAAQVGKILITYDDIRRDMAQFSTRIRESSSTAQEYEARMTELANQTLQNLVDRSLMIIEFRTKGYKIPSKESDLEFRRILKDNFNGSMSELIAELQQQGLTLPAYRKRLEENLMVSALRGRFRNELPDITPSEIQTYYQANQPKFAQSGRVKLTVITLKPLTDEPAEVLLQNANEIKAKAQAGEDFDALATEHNQGEDPHWDWLKLTDLAEMIRAEVATLKAGEISQPVVLNTGDVLLIKMQERQDEGVAALADVQEQIRQELGNEKANEAYSAWINQLKKKYFVKINLQ